MNMQKLKQVLSDNASKKLLFAIITLLVLNIILYIGTVGHDFLKDDFRLIVENPRIKDFQSFVSSIGGKFFAFPDFPYLHYWRPMSLFSFYIDYRLWGLKPGGYHFFNVLINAFNALLVFLIFWVVSGRLYFAFPVSLFFSIHPSHVEAVSWISGRTDLLSAFFILSATLFFILFLKKRKGRYYAAAAVLFVLALLSKENGVLFPLLAVVLVFITPVEGRDGSEERGQRRPGAFKAILFTLPFWLIDAGYIILHNRFSGVQDVLSHFSLKDIFVIVKTIGAYTRIILLPFLPTSHFSMHYFDSHHLEFLAYFLLAVLILWLLISKRENYRYSLYSLLFFIFLLPVLDPEIVPSYPKIVIRFAYIPAIFAGVFFLESLKLLKLNRARILFTGLFVFIGLIWLFQSYTFQDFYKNERYHYFGLVRYYPDDGSLLLPAALLKASDGQHRAALALVDHALAMNYKDRWLDVSEMGGLLKANLLVITGKPEQGKALAESILNETKKDEMKYFGFLVLSRYYDMKGNLPDSLRMLQEAGKKGETADLFWRMAVVYGKMRDFRRALVFLEKARYLNPEIKRYAEFKQVLLDLLEQQNRQRPQNQDNKQNTGT
jgi:tetratricopeptide (TPR) repeat protein